MVGTVAGKGRCAARLRSAEAVEQVADVAGGADDRPEQRKTRHHQQYSEDAPSSSCRRHSPTRGRARASIRARPLQCEANLMQTAEEIMQADIAEKPVVAAAECCFYSQTPTDLTRASIFQRRCPGQAVLPVGVLTCAWRSGVTWERLAGAEPGRDQATRSSSLTRALPAPAAGERRPSISGDADRDVPAARAVRCGVRSPGGIPAGVSAGIFFNSRPELGDVSRGEVVSINNFHRLFKDILTPVQLDGLRLLLTPLPQEEFNPTDDRKTRGAELGRHLL